MNTLGQHGIPDDDRPPELTLRCQALRDAGHALRRNDLDAAERAIEEARRAGLIALGRLRDR
ncbi:MAG: hypothetical protein ACYDHD_03525 [Vulcanimicrobiaceae bacterium]